MAIYKNREVSISPTTFRPVASQEVHVVQADGTHEVAPIGAVHFTKDELDNLKKFDSTRYNDMEPITQDDLDAVRLGLAPSFDEGQKQAAIDKKAAADRDAKQKQIDDMLAKRKDVADAALKPTQPKQPEQLTQDQNNKIVSK